ncbi:MAG TPA: Ppx/GppA phosphatase family protein [Tepidisphaeraceae bacterium]|jgi:exopolyphosphatase/guanosine-5'-triphosphate,3'-diphosphate pyrophosphatase
MSVLSHTAVSRRGAAQSGARDSLRLAAIDVGSNSVHMIVAQADPDGAVTTLWRMKEMVGLGRMSFPSHKLTRESMDNAMTALARFQQAAQQRQAEKIVAVATSAIREATNGGDFIMRIKRELGLYVRVISARDEARLIYLAVRHAMELRDKPHLIIDIGGGSVEFIVGDSKHAMMLESSKLGAARMSAQFVKSDPIDKRDCDKLRRHYDEILTPICEHILAHKPVKVIGTSGTLECIATLCGSTAESNGHGEGAIGTIEQDKSEKVCAELLESNTKERARMRGLDDQRRDQIVAGAMLVDELFKRLRLRRIQICGSALREGILLDYLNRHIPEMTIRREVPDPRRRSVIDLARKCDWHKTHSEHVAKLCLELFDDLRPLHGLGSIERELIDYAALLHDIGWHIGRTGHHKHSMYLIANGDLKSFTDEEIQIIANIARYHRKAEPKKSHEGYVQLSSSARRIVDVGAAFLRLADGLDRSHVSAITKLSCRIKDRNVKCTLSAKSDAELEIWGARRKMGLFEKVFGRKITFALSKR